MLKTVSGVALIAVLATVMSGTAQAQQYHRPMVGPMPGSTQMMYQPRRFVVPQWARDAGATYGKYGGRQVVGRKIMRYAPRTGRIIQGSPWGAVGSVLLWPDVAE